MGNKEMIELINLTKVIDKKTIIDNINLTINKGEIFGFLGKNGAGKTTTIKMIVGLLKITSGKVFINGYNIQSDFEKAIRNVGAIIEKPDLYENLTGYQNLKLVARIYDIKEDKVKDVINIIGLKEKINDKVKKYSLGMKQRLAIGIAIVREPKILILDEPTNGLDPNGIHEFREIIINLARKKNITILVSSHILSEMELMCDRVAIIDNGNIVAIKNINEKSDSYKKENYYFDTTNNTIACDILINENYNANIIDGKICLSVDKYEVQNIINLINKNSIRIFEIVKSKSSLEEIFISVTGGN